MSACVRLCIEHAHTRVLVGSVGTAPATVHIMSNERPAWNDVQRLTDELEVQIRLAGVDARDRWHRLEPRFEKLGLQIVHSGERAGQIVVHELRDALRALGAGVYTRARSDFNRGW
jgi:hypothetical protein